jgi:hypothetical protein
MMPSTSLPQCWLCGQPCPLEDCTIALLLSRTQGPLFTCHEATVENYPRNPPSEWGLRRCASPGIMVKTAVYPDAA